MGRIWRIITNNTLANILLWGGMFLVLLRILTFDLTVLYAAGGICSEEDMLRQKIERQIYYDDIPVHLRKYVAPDTQVVLLFSLSNIELTQIFREARPISFYGIPPCWRSRQRVVAIFQPTAFQEPQQFPSYYDPEFYIRKDAPAGLPFAYRPVGEREANRADYVLPETHDLVALIPLPEDMSVAIGDAPLLMHRAYDLRDHDIVMVPHLVNDVDWWRQADALYVGRGE